MRRMRLLLVLLLVFLFSYQAIAAPDSAGATRLQNALQVFTKTMAAKRATLPSSFLEQASGIIIIPRLVKMSFLFGARRGKGVLIVKNGGGNWGNPVMITVTGGSVGLQAGISSSDVVMVFRRNTPHDIKSQGNFIMGADVSLVAGIIGLQMDENTDAGLQTEIYSFSHSVGLNAGFALQGSSLKVDEAATSALYGRSGLSSKDILSGKVDPIPLEVTRFRQAIQTMTDKAP